MDVIGRVESGTETEQLSRVTPEAKADGDNNQRIVFLRVFVPSW
jgi:hypothetical protein